MRRKWLIAAAAFGTAALLAFARAQEVQDTVPSEAASGSSIHPIAFPHDVHATTYQIDCTYCHFSADRSVDAGIPTVEMCMGCHTLVGGSENPEEIERLREFWNEREPIPWGRVYRVHDFVRFPHMRHVQAGLSCQTCHGQVQEMGVIESRAPEWRGNDMGWCVSCHVEMGASRDCTVCHY